MTTELSECLERLGVKQPAAISVGGKNINGGGDKLKLHSPIDGSLTASFPLAKVEQVHAVVDPAVDAFRQWRDVPAPRRGELVRQYGEILREHKSDLGMIVSWEAGKITQEALGEVQEMIDICDMAVGLSRTIAG